MISGNMVGSYSQLGKTFIITDADGNELTGVVVDQETVFTATDNDVREGLVYASDEGVSTGTKNIPAYRTTTGRKAILPGESFSLNLSDYNKYDYTKFQCIITVFNTTLDDSVAADKIVIGDNVYHVNATEPLSALTKNAIEKSIDFNITNNTESTYVIYYFTYKEEE